MKRCCVVVADGQNARIYLLEEAQEPVSGSRLVAQAELVNNEIGAPGRHSERNTSRQSGPMHPYGDKRQQHRVEVDRRFAHEVATQALSRVKDWAQGTLLVVAEPHMLGLMRDALHGRLGRGMELKELARDYTHLTPGELHRQLNF